MERRVYSSKYADDDYRRTLVESREGINQTPESIQRMNDIVTPLIRKGQSIGHIYATHAEEIGCSRKTLYEYIAQGVFDVGNLDMRRVVRYKKRKKRTRCSATEREYRKGHNYQDFLKYMKSHPGARVVEMDTVVGKKGGKAFLTMLFRSCNLMLIFLIDSQTQAEVKRIFDFLTDGLGTERFRSIFEVILTDGGSEFSDRTDLEITDDGVVRTSVYYCDPYSSWQKGALEKNHEYIRYVIPKGKTFDMLTEEKVRRLMNHINSEKRDSLNGHSPYELSQLLLDNELHALLGLEEIAPDEVNLKPELIS
jgi:IS30 family transposase